MTNVNVSFRPKLKLAFCLFTSRNDSWIIISIIAVITGILASIMKITVEKFQIFYLPFISDLIDVLKILESFFYYSFTLLQKSNF